MLTPGSTIGTYEIIGPLGSGGMGEVYRARDSKLKREVAIKILPEGFAQDAERVARFRREAEILASLNHPHIGAIYDFGALRGFQFLVLELVEGETLADRIARGPIPINEALKLAKQIADALEAAHEKGIIHRDLKPANIKVSRDDMVKVLDFGLAKVWETAPGTTNISNSPTLMSTSLPGMILGTAAYMSPEQTKGQETDRTGDVWAFGCVLYEMLTGKAVFAGDTLAEVIAGVMKEHPVWARLPRETPFPIRRLLRRCLEKDRRQRLRCMGDAMLEIVDVQSNPSLDLDAAPVRGQRSQWIVWIAFAVMMLAAALAAVMAFRPAPPSHEMRLDIVTPPSPDPTSLAISPDGLKLAFVADSGNAVLWLRALDSGAVRPLTGTENAAFPFWSPDSRSIGFFAGGKLKRLDIESGLVRSLADAAGRGGTWNRDGVIVFAPGANTPIFRIPSEGGAQTAVTRLKGQQGTHRQPHFLPDGQHFLFWGQDGGIETRAIYAGDLNGSEPKRILDSDVAAVFAPPGQLLFFREGLLFAQNFDAARLTLSGTPSLVAEQVFFNPGFNLAALSVSSAGSIAFRTGTSSRQLVWFDRNGKEIEKIGNADQASSQGASLSPDQRQVAVERTVSGNIDIWILETARGVLRRFTSDSSRQRWPQWSPDGSQIAYASNPNGTYDLYRKSADGNGNEELLLMTPQSKSVQAWSADGDFVLFGSLDPKTGADLWALPLSEPRKPFPLVQTEFDQTDGQFSPDGKWIAYQSNESGRYEIYVQPFPGGGNKTQISLGGGTQVRWRRDGKTLFYVGPDNRLMEAPVRLGINRQAVEPGSPVALFVTHVGDSRQSTDMQQYAVSGDGQRFLMNTVADQTTIRPITVILNWSSRQ